MGVIDLWSLARAILLVAVANTAPLLAQKLLGSRFAAPIDGGTVFLDKRPLFGQSKTLRGVIASVLLTIACGAFFGIDPGVAALVAAAAMAGDLLSSFVKRRLDMPPSSRATGWDQLPECLLPLLLERDALSLSFVDIAIACSLFFIGEIVLARMFFKLRLRDKPY